ncbi:MAG: ester cyclase [Thermoleophilaceae bacterium]
MNELARIDDVAAAWLAAWTGARPFGDSCTPDVQYEDPLVVDPLRGLDDLDEHAARLRSAIPDLRLDRTAPALTGGPYACIAWRAAGTHKNDAPSLPRTNRFITLQGLHYLELADGQIHRARGFFDLYDTATQLGILPPRGGLGETALLLLRGFGLRARS